MEGYLVPAVVIAIVSIIIQGIWAGFELYDRRKARSLAARQGSIALCVALMQLADATGRSPGETLEIKKSLVRELLSGAVPEDVLRQLGLSDTE
ncbi:MAG: hypothetical protein JW753_11635 [Dehalococcoidia bacterium]|nr:hypothetical protein [Dehalococcoidia bacterium]